MEGTVARSHARTLIHMASSELLTEATTSVRGPSPTEGGFVGRFGLDPWLLFAQVVNFLIVVFVLTRFVFRPLLRTLRERTASIEKGLRDAEAAASLRAAAAEEQQQARRRAAEEIARKLRAAEDEANRLRESVLRTTEEEAAAMHDRAEAEAARLKQDALRAAVAEAGDVVVDAVEHALAKSLTSGEREAYRDAALRELHTRT